LAVPYLLFSPFRHFVFSFLMYSARRFNPNRDLLQSLLAIQRPIKPYFWRGKPGISVVVIIKPRFGAGAYYRDLPGFAHHKQNKTINY
jgi:hypothetical protein